MICLIVGAKGSGKTKRIIDLGNSYDTDLGDVVFITDTNRYMYDIKRTVRFVNTAEYPVIASGDALLGFVSGLIAGNADITNILIDGIVRMTKSDLKDLETVFAEIGKLAEANNVKFTITASCAEDNLPEYLKAIERC